MRTEQIIVFSRSDVQAYKEAIGFPDRADAILPLHMPNIAYKQLHIPWRYEAPVILRKQEIEIIKPLEVNVDYEARLELAKIKSRGERTFIEEQLTISDESGLVLFISQSQLVTGGVHK